VSRATSEREFLYLARHRQPAEAAQIKALGIPGVYTSREYRRYYPASEVTGHLLGFTNVDDAGQEGLELAFDHWLAGEDGAKRVIQDRYGRIVQNVESIRPARPGRDLVLSIDLRIQYLAYRELKAAIRDQHARAGSAVVLDVASGEVLAMVNQPAYNPNDREQIQAATYRNRAATDIFEPGSSIKPFFVAAGLASGKYDNRSVIDTSPGFFKVGVKIFEDEHNYGTIDIATVLAKSSNVGMAHIALTLPPQEIWNHAQTSGFRPGHHQRLSGGVGGSLACLLAVASHRHRHHVTWLRLVGHAAAAGACLRNHRRVRHRPSGVVPARRGSGPWRAHARSPSVPRIGRHARVGGGRRRHRQARGHSGLSRIGQDRHRVEGHRRRLLDRSLHGGVSAGWLPRASPAWPRWWSSTNRAPDCTWADRSQLQCSPG